MPPCRQTATGLDTCAPARAKPAADSMDSSAGASASEVANSISSIASTVLGAGKAGRSTAIEGSARRTASSAATSDRWPSRAIPRGRPWRNWSLKISRLSGPS